MTLSPTALLIRGMSRAESPRAIRAYARALEIVTGLRTDDLGTKARETLASFDTVSVAEMYKREGFHDIASILGSYSSYTGRTVTPLTALESAAVYACGKIIAEDMGAIPFFLHQRSGDSVRKAEEHPLYTVLHDLPNPELSAGEFVEQMTFSALFCRNGFAKIDRDSSGRAMFLWPLEGQMEIKRDERKQLVFIHRQNSKDPEVFTRDQIFHLRGFHIGGVEGDDLLTRARHVFGMTLAQQEYAGRFFAKDASPGIIIKRPIEAPAITATGVEMIKQKWIEWHQGLNRAHEPAVLTEGMEAVRLDPDHQKLQLIEQRKFQVVEVARLFRVPLHKLADLDRATFSNIEEQDLAYGQDVLTPWSVRWRQAVYRCLLTQEERRAGFFAEHNLDAYVRTRLQERSAAFGSDVQNGIRTRNEVRRLLNMNPVQGGDELTIQLNMQALTSMDGTVRDSGTKVVAVRKGYVNGKGVADAGIESAP